MKKLNGLLVLLMIVLFPVAVWTADGDPVLVSDTPIAYIDNHTILVSEFGKTLTMAHADSKTFTLPLVGAEHDGAEVTLMRIGAGNMVVCRGLGGDAYTVGSATDTQVTVTTLYGLVKLKYIHSTTTWAILWSKGSYTGA